MLARIRAGVMEPHLSSRHSCLIQIALETIHDFAVLVLRLLSFRRRNTSPYDEKQNNL